MNGITIEGVIDRICDMYSSYTLSKLDDSGNVFNIVKGKYEEEVYGKCNGCTCGATSRKGRWINKNTGKCFYQDMTTRNYTTKISK
jgi:hypothetical protein